MYIYNLVYIHIPIYIHVHNHIHICMHLYNHIYISSYIHPYIHVYIAHTQPCMAAHCHAGLITNPHTSNTTLYTQEHSYITLTHHNTHYTTLIYLYTHTAPCKTLLHHSLNILNIGQSKNRVLPSRTGFPQPQTSSVILKYRHTHHN